MNRDVFYLAGFDPRSYRFYYTIFKNNAFKTSRINAKDIKISPLNHKKIANFTIDYQNSQTKYHFLSWNDIVAKHFIKNLFDLFKVILIWFRAYIFSGIIFTFAKEIKIRFIAGFYPTLFVIFSYVLTFFIVDFLLDILKLNLIFRLIIYAISLYFISKIIFYVSKKTAICWLLSIYAFCYKYAKNEIFVQDKVENYSNFIIENLKKNINNKNYEALLIAHSVGTILAINIAARVLRICKQENIDFTNFKLILLGECIPLVTFHKYSTNFKNDLKLLAEEKFIWLDFTSTIDGACFALFDFLKSAKISPKKGCGVQILSTKFFKIYTKNTYKKIRYKWYDVHFLYLKATQIASGYDYFYITCNNNKLESKSF